MGEDKSMRENTEKDVFDPTFTFHDLISQVCSGKLRWLSTTLAVANIILLVLSFFNIFTPAIYFPIHLEGNGVIILLFVTLLIWFSLAIINWNNWFKKKIQDKP